MTKDEGDVRVYRIRPQTLSCSPRKSSKPHSDTETSAKDSKTCWVCKRPTSSVAPAHAHLSHLLTLTCHTSSRSPVAPAHTHLIHLLMLTLTCWSWPAGWKAQLGRFWSSCLRQTVLVISKSTMYLIPLTTYKMTAGSHQFTSQVFLLLLLLNSICDW